MARSPKKTPAAVPAPITKTAPRTRKPRAPVIETVTSEQPPILEGVVFRFLNGRDRSASELADRLGRTEAETTAVLTALKSDGLVATKEGVWTLTPAAHDRLRALNASH